MKVLPLAVGATTSEDRFESTTSKSCRCQPSGLKLTRPRGSFAVPTVRAIWGPRYISWKAYSSLPTPDQTKSTSLVTLYDSRSFSSSSSFFSFLSFLSFLSSFLSFLSSFLSFLSSFLSSFPFFLSSFPLSFSLAFAADSASFALWSSQVLKACPATFGKPMQINASWTCLMPLPSSRFPYEFISSWSRQKRYCTSCLAFGCWGGGSLSSCIFLSAVLTDLTTLSNSFNCASGVFRLEVMPGKPTNVSVMRVKPRHMSSKSFSSLARSNVSASFSAAGSFSFSLAASSASSLAVSSSFRLSKISCCFLLIVAFSLSLSASASFSFSFSVFMMIGGCSLSEPVRDLEYCERARKASCLFFSANLR
mmetsp:Transcript_34833/g.97838  ORF Transcript_34833/g.97838 Transcript_34833/m.97838 type:complete len:364 (+) Transcript_34833:3262-4353(+)